MFTVDERQQLRTRMLELAAQDQDISGAALTGSAVDGREDPWSDIDLAFGVRDGQPLCTVMDRWTARMYRTYGAVHHIDLQAGPWIYRVFLLANTLQVDLAFVPQAEFRATAPSFRLVSGTARAPEHWPPPSVGSLIGMGWLYALHVRSSLARGHRWQAEYMISAMRDTALAMACLRHDLPAAHGKGIDKLPEHVTAGFEAALVRALDSEELARAFSAANELLLIEIREANVALAAQVEATLRQLAG